MKHPILMGLVLTWGSPTLWAQATTAADPQTTSQSEPQAASQPAAEATTTPPIDTQSSTAETLAELTQPAADATSVKVIVQKKQTIEEYRQRGELVLVKVIPNDGVPYYIDPLERDKENGAGKDLLNSGVKPVRWVLKEF